MPGTAVPDKYRYKYLIAIAVTMAAMLELIDMKGSNRLLPAELSGGMQKRAGLARAIILEPQIILFDEPTAGLDPVNTKRLLDNIIKLKGDALVHLFVFESLVQVLDVKHELRRVAHDGYTVMMKNLVRKKSATMMKMLVVTTTQVVVLPTPCVPPSVVRPFQQAVTEMT